MTETQVLSGMTQKPNGVPKEKIAITVEKRVLEWADKQVQTLKYRNRSHVFEYAVVLLMEQEKKESER
jgi:Arc/MetJ-type ribon-helix-helix transcriptional regulator